MEYSEVDVPWMCGIIRSDNRWRGCGATLLGCNPAVLVTAAHCLTGLNMSEEVRVSCGARRMSLSRPSPLDPGEVRLVVRRVVSHPGYRESSLTLTGRGLEMFRFLHDIAVMMVEDGKLPCNK